MSKPLTLENKMYFVLDMDGTFYLGEKLLEGSLNFIRCLENSGRDYVFFTNNSSKNSEEYVKKLDGLGLSVNKEKIITSGMVTAKYINDTYPGMRVFLLGTPALYEEFANSGINLVEDEPEIVVVGFDTTLTYARLAKACDFIRNGCIFIATHPDINCPTETGFIPDCGAMCALIASSTGKTPKNLGKPYIETLRYLLEHFNCDKEEIVFVGDRLYTDIAIGFNHNVTSVLVLTGETKLKDLENSTIQPDVIVNRLFDLGDLIRDIPQEACPQAAVCP